MSKKKLSFGKDGVCMVVPEGWIYKPIKELADIYNGGTPSIANKSYWNGRIIWITPSDITTQQKKYIYYSERQISELGLKNSSALLMPKGTLLLCSRATIGEISIAGLPLATNQGFKNLICFENVDEEFLYYAIQPLKQKMIEQAIGTTFLEISKTALGNIEILISDDKSEQRAIAEALSDMDGYIASLDKLIAKKKALKQGAMQELFTGKRRLPGFEGEWKIKTLGDIGHFIKESINPQAFSDTLFSEYSMPAFDENRLPKYVWGSQMHSIRIKITDKVLLFNKLNVRQKRIWFIDNCSSNAVCSSEFLPFYSTQVNLVFLAQVLFSDKATSDFEGMSTGTSNSQKRITPDDFLNHEIYIPQIAEQSAIAAVLSDMDAEIEVLTAKLNKAKSIKQGMMQELLTGRIRLVRPKENIAPVIKMDKKDHHGYSEDDKDAVILGALTSIFGTEQHPFTAFDCQKFPYLFHRHVEGTAKGYKKFAAGPYNPDLKYRTARPIALERRYIRECTGLYKGFVADENIQEALNYFAERYGDEPIKWLDQFHYIRNRKEELELLTTVDQAMVELRQTGNPVTMHTVKEVIRKTPVWKDKLTRPIFSDENIFRAIEWSIRLFGKEE